MQRFTEGDRVRIDLPDQDDPDHNQFHGRKGTVVAVLEDDAGTATGDVRDSTVYCVALEDEVTMDFRWRDLRPP